MCGFPVWVLALLLFSIPGSTTLYNSPFYYGPFLSEKSSNFPTRGSIFKLDTRMLHLDRKLEPYSSPYSTWNQRLAYCFGTPLLKPSTIPTPAIPQRKLKQLSRYQDFWQHSRSATSARWYLHHDHCSGFAPLTLCGFGKHSGIFNWCPNSNSVRRLCFPFHLKCYESFHRKATPNNWNNSSLV